MGDGEGDEDGDGDGDEVNLRLQPPALLFGGWFWISVANTTGIKLRK